MNTPLNVFIWKNIIFTSITFLWPLLSVCLLASLLSLFPKWARSFTSMLLSEHLFSFEMTKKTAIYLCHFVRTKLHFSFLNVKDTPFNIYNLIIPRGNFPMTRSVRWSVGRSVITSDVPIGTLVNFFGSTEKCVFRILVLAFLTAIIYLDQRVSGRTDGRTDGIKESGERKMSIIN